MSSNAPPVVLKEGFLSKRSRNAWPVARFQRRYFRLYAGELQYFYTPLETAPRRRVQLRLDTRVTPTNDQGYERCFVVKTSPTENFYVQAEKEDEKEDWVTAIYNALRRTDDVADPRVDEPPLSPSMMMPPPPAPQQPPSRILLHLNVVEATGLKGVNYLANAKSDPFCVINFIGKDGAMIRTEEIRTKYITETTEPVWNEHFTLGHAVDLASVEAIHFELQDHEVMGTPKPLGFVKVPLSMFQMSPASTGQSELVDRSFRVEPPPDKPTVMDYVTGGSSSPRNERKEQETMIRDHGKLHLVMSIVGPNLVNFFRGFHHTIAPQNRIVTEGVDHTDNRLEVTVLCAKDLIAADFNKSSDPFVELTLLDSRAKPIRGEHFRTTIKEKTRNPAWQDEHHIFGRISRIEEASQLLVRVLDWDEHSKNDPLGRVVVSLAGVSTNTHTAWYTLQPEDTMAVRENLGSIQLKISLAGETLGERNRRLQIEKQVASKAHEMSVEQLELENAQHQLHEAACSLDGARIACTVNDYQAREPQFYGLNGCIHHLNAQLPRAHSETTSSDEGFQSRAGIEGQALLEVCVVGTHDLRKAGTTVAATNPYALIEVDPSVCIEECKRISAPQSPQKSKRVEAGVAATEARSGLFARRAQAEVSSHRAKLGKNEMRSERHFDMPSNQPMLKVEVKSGHGLTGVDFGGYSDPYCTLSLTDRTTGKSVESEKKRTAVIQKTLNPVWGSEVFIMGHNFPLEKAGSLLIHVKDHNMTRSTPLGRVQIPLSDLCHASATTTSISSTAKERRYALMPEPWMKKHAQHLGELCIKTEVIGDATLLAEMLQRFTAADSPGKMLSFLSMQSFASDAHLSDGMSSMSLSGYVGDEDEITEVIDKGKQIRTSTAVGTSASWRKEKFSLLLSYPGLFSGYGRDVSSGYVLHLRVHGARNLLGFGELFRGSRSEKEHHHRNCLLGRRSKTSAYFTVIPVHREGQLEHQERKQSLTVYGTSCPNWPEKEFVFDKLKSLQSVSYLSLHVYSRDLENEVTKPIALLLSDDERQQRIGLKRFQIRKIGSTGLVDDDDGHDVLWFGQRVLAYRRCGNGNGGRFFPATVQKYRPFPVDDYVVLFEDGIETIDDLWDMFSTDVKGKIEAIHADGSVDVSILSESSEQGKADYAHNVSPSLLTPVDAFTASIESVMARRMNEEEECKQSWLTLKHTLSGLTLDVLAVTGLPKHVARPRCEITFIGNPHVVLTRALWTVAKNGQLKLKVGASLGGLTQTDDSVASFKLGFDHAVGDVDQKRFEKKLLILGSIVDDGVGYEDSTKWVDEKNFLLQAASLLIEIIDEEGNANTGDSRRVVGSARVDLVTLSSGAHDIQLRLVPPDHIDYFKHVGSLNLHIECVGPSREEFKQYERTSAERGVNQWSRNRAEAEDVAFPLLENKASRKLTRIGRRQLLRSSLTPTENAQVDAFHTVLVVVMKRVVSILHEIKLFEDFETLATEDFPKFHHVHTVNADVKSEWLGRPINEMPLETRKTVVDELEFELLDIGASQWERPLPHSGPISREEWVQLRTVRQQALQKVSGCFMQDRVNAVMVRVPCCFTGEGMARWICSRPEILWADKWIKYCHDERTKEACRLHWDVEQFDPDAMDAPKTPDQALLWLNALGDAGFVENVSVSLSTGDANKKFYLVESKPDRLYRIREVELWLRKEAREKSLFPLDLVREVDCVQQLDLVHVEPPPASPSASPKKGKKASSPKSTPSEVVVPVTKSDVLNAQKRTYAKKLVDHVEGFLGLQNAFSTILFSREVQANSLLKPAVAKTQQYVAEMLLWDWKYCLFIPGNKMLYVYESDVATAPTIILDMNSTVCHAAYNFTYEAKGGWFNVVSAMVLHAAVTGDGSIKYSPIGDELRDKLMKVTADGSLVFEFKTSEAQLWVQSFVRANVRVDMKPQQLVLLKRLNPTVLQSKCVDNVANFNPKDLEGSFQGMLNKFFKHDLASSHQEHEQKMRSLRAKARSEMKKAGVVGEAVMAYFGKGQLFNPGPGPNNGREYTRGALYSGSIVRIRTPFVDAKYRFTHTYDIKTAPAAMQALLLQYKVTDKESWLKVPKATRDVFLVYDVEYRHAHEIIQEEGMLREHLRTHDGDLDPLKVQERCTDLNIWFKPSDLEDCVTRIVMHTGVQKPLGCVKIPIKTVSAHRVMDVWYPLAPEKDMVNKANLGQIRVQLRITPATHILRSSKIPAHLLEEIKEAAAATAAGKPLAVAAAAATSPLKMLKDKVYKTLRMPMSPTVAGASAMSRERSFVTIRIIEGRKMIAADVRTSDPYVKIILIREKDEREEPTKLKTDIKYNTLSPKWTNQEFVLGKTHDTLLSGKKAILLRVMDHDLTSTDDPMGCLKIELQRDKSGYVSGLVLVHADEKGSPTSRVLHLNNKLQVEVDEKLLADEKTGMSKTDAARGNNPAVDGKLGRLRFVIEVAQNENFVDPNGVSAAQMTALMRGLETKFSYEVEFKSIAPEKNASSISFDALRQCSCVFIPKGDGGQRINYDLHTEDLGHNNTLKLGELLASQSAGSGHRKILGRTFDMSKVSYFDVEVHHPTNGKTFSGRFGERIKLRDPRKHDSMLQEVVLLTDKDNKDVQLKLTISVGLVAIHRAQRLKRLLAETFRMVGLDFDVRRINDESKRSTQAAGTNLHDLLWGVCKAHFVPGRQMTQVLLAQVHRMGQSARLHWKFTPQLLGLVLEHVFLFGEKDRLSYDDAVALDEVLSRWSLVLQHLNEAKTQLVGHLHGMETPRLIHTLMGECDWTGFELVSLRDEASSPSSTTSSSMAEQQLDALEETVLRPGTKVHALLAHQRKHAGIPVDVKLSTGDYVAGTITTEHGHDIFDVAFCTNAKVHEEGDAYFSDDDELPPLSIGQAVFMCPVAHSSNDSAHSAGTCVSGKVGRVKAIDTEHHPDEPYGIVLDGEDEAKQAWAPRVWLDTTFHRVFGDVLHPQLVKDDFVRVFKPTGTEDSRGAGMLARVVRNHRNGKYDVQCLDLSDVKKAIEGDVELSGSNTVENTIEMNVPRKRLAPVSDKEVWEAQILRTYLAPSSAVARSGSDQLVVTYDLCLENGDSIEGITRGELRPAHDVFPSDKCVLASIFSPSFEIQDKDEADTYVTKRLQELYAHDELVKVYVILPAKPDEISVRDRCSTKALQVKLERRDPSKPRFVEQCHGYATTFTEVEASKLEQIFDTAVVLRGETARSNRLDVFDIKKCFCLYMAPQPRVEIHGALRVTPEKSNKASRALFLMLRHTASTNKPRLLAAFQQMIRNTASVHMPLDRKGRVVLMKDVSVSGEQLSVGFEIGIAPKNLGSLARAVDVAYQDAARIFERLGKLKCLVAYGDDHTCMEEIDWMLEVETPRVTAATALVVQVLGRKGDDNSKPSLTLEMLPLDDQRLSVKDAYGKVWDLCLPMDRILVEAQLRRHLVPFHEAKVVSVSTKQELLQTQLHPPQVNKRRRRDSTLQNKPTEPLKLKKRISTGRQLQVRFSDNATADVAEHDIKFDSLHVLVKQASELTLDERVGNSDLDVDVMLVSRDFRSNAEGDQALMTPFGDILYDTGEIRRDYAGNQYPQRSTQRLTKDWSSTGWKALGAATPLAFGYPGIDLERVSHVRVRIWAKNHTILVGTSDIPIADIPVVGFNQASSAGNSIAVQSSLLTKWTRSKPTGRDLLSHSSCEHTVSLCKKEHNQDNSVGKITLHMERVRAAKGGDIVLAKRLLKEADAWKVSEYELLALTLKQHDDHLMRGLLATSSIVPHGGLRLLPDLVEQELQLQKIANVMMIAHAMELIYATKPTDGQPSSQALALRDGTAPLPSRRMLDQVKLAMDQTKWFIEDTATELGIRTSAKRLPWSAEVIKGERLSGKGEHIVMRANMRNTSTRVRRTMLKLYQMYRNQLIPTLQRLYEADAMGEAIDIHEGEQLLRFFEQEVEDLDYEDQHVFRRVYQRIRLIKIAKVLQDIMHTSLIVTVMNYDHAMGDDEIGTAYVPLIDLLDRVEHDNGYDLMKKRRSAGRGTSRPGSPQSIVQFASSASQGKVHLRIKLSYSESSLLEQATRIYKIMKDKFVAQHEVARRRINAAVVPAQRRRWMTIKGYLEELQEQARSKLHWERTPVLLSLVWDIFLTPDHARCKPLDEDEEKHLEGLVEKANEYRSAVVDVHKRWANLQPLLEELLQIQGATQIHARRTPELLDQVDREVEGLDLVLSTAYQQVLEKWIELRNALEALVRMKERKKIHMAHAPQLLTKVTQRCSKGLNDRYADAVSEVQFRWMAITKSDGPLNELRLTEKKGLHWRRTHELVLLLNEQCEGFADVDAKTLDIVQKRWEQVQEWLNDVVQMQIQHTIDCEVTPFILKKMHLVESRNKAATGATAKHAVEMKKRMQAAPVSPRSRSPTRTGERHPPPSPRGYSTTSISSSGHGATADLVDVDVDVDRLEGLAEWYAIEESKRELERIPFHRITTDYDRNNRLKYSQDGRDTRLFITQEEMAFTPRNVRAALADRGVIPVMASLAASTAHTATDIASPTKLRATTTIPKDLLDEIHHLEQSIESIYADGGSLSVRYVKWNPERVAELYVIIESLGKSDLLWKIDHAVNTNHEIEVPGNVNKLLVEMKLRSIQTTEIDNLIRTLLVALQKEELAKMGVDVPSTANFTAVLSLMHRHQVKDVVLPVEISNIQALLQKYGMDKKGEPVFLRGMRIGTQMWCPDDGPADGAHASVQGKTSVAKINTGLGIIDAKIEQLRKTLLMEALRKRNSLIKTFPVESFILTEEELAECTEVDTSGDYLTLIEAFQQLLIHESYTKRLAEYAAMDRCMRALVGVPADKIVTKEDIATKLQTLGSRFRLPLEAFTRDELLEAASRGKIRTPTEEMLTRCPVGQNAKAMAYYAAMSHTALVFQEIVRFRVRLDPMTSSFVDAFPFERASTADGLSVPKNRSRMSFKEYMVDWLLGSEDSVVKLQRRLGAYHRQRLEWASAAFTLRNRWYQRGFGWCDNATRCAGVKVLLQKLLLFEAANKMHMVDTESLLSEVNDKCVNLRAREREAKEQLEQRYMTNLERLETLVIHAEKCMNNRKIHAEEAPALLHAIEQACIVPHGLQALHKQAYHVVSTHWTRHRARLSELVHMQKQGTFSIERTPELLSAMEFHTEGIAGADELTMEKVMATASASSTPVEMQQRYVDKKVDEIRRGQRKQNSTLRLNLDEANTEKDVVLDELKEESDDTANQWESLSPSMRDVRPLSPRDKQTSWKVVTTATTAASAALSSPTKPSIVIEDKYAMFEQRRKSSIGDDLRELLKSPSKWLIASSEPQEVIRPEVFFPREVTMDLSHSTAVSASESTPAQASASDQD